MARRRRGLTFYQREKRITHAKVAGAMSWVFIVVIAILLAFFLVFSYGLQTTVIGSSMEPSLTNGQVVFLDRLLYSVLSPHRGDVVAFRPNGNTKAHLSVKRVIGVPGDRIQIRNGILYRNGEGEEELFEDKIADAGLASDELLLDTDEYFVMGDNCNSSEDSRSPNLGLVKREHIVGKAWLHLSGENSGIGRVR